jgi:hypothetical protein
VRDSALNSEPGLTRLRFFIGSNVFGWPLQAIRALTDGHEICVHTWSHQRV